MPSGMGVKHALHRLTGRRAGSRKQAAHTPLKRVAVGIAQDPQVNWIDGVSVTSHVMGRVGWSGIDSNPQSLCLCDALTTTVVVRFGRLETMGVPCPTVVGIRPTKHVVVIRRHDMGHAISLPDDLAVGDAHHGSSASAAQVFRQH